MRTQRVGLSAGVILFMARGVCAQEVPRLVLETTPGARCVVPSALAPYLASVFGRDPVVPDQESAPRVRVAESGDLSLRVVVSLQPLNAPRAFTLQELRAPRARCASLLTSVASTLRDHLLPPRASSPHGSPPTTSAPIVDRSREVIVPSAATRPITVVMIDAETAWPRPAPAPPPPPTGPRFGLQLLLEAYGAVDMMPSPSFGARFGVRVRTHPRGEAGFVVGIALRGDLPSTADYPQGSLETWAIGGDLALCGQWRFLDGCGVAHVGSSTSQAAGADGRSSMRWLVGAQLGATVRLAGPFGLRASVEALASPTRTHQEIGRIPVWTSPWVAFTGGAGAVIEFR